MTCSRSSLDPVLAYDWGSYALFVDFLGKNYIYLPISFSFYVDSTCVQYA